MRRLVAAALLCAGTVAYASGPVTLEVEPWPAERDCEVCTSLQFGTMEMRLPLAEIGKIAVTTVGSEAALHLIPKSGQLTDGLVLLEPRLEKGRLKSVKGEQFFDQLGGAPGNDKAIASLRRVYGIDTAARYTKASKDGIHVYWIRSDDRQLNAVYFVTDGSNTTYLLGGPITQTLYETLLANLRVTKIP